MSVIFMLFIGKYCVCWSGICTISVEFEQLADTEAFCFALHQCWNFRNEGSYSRIGCKIIY